MPKPEIAVERVKQRVLEGGHSIPKDVIIRRYHAGIDNFFKIFMGRVDSWMLVENYSVPRIIIASGGKKASLRIDNEELYKKVKEYVR